MNELIAFWSYAVAACLFGSVVLWRLRERLDGPARLLVAAYIATAVWASTSAVRGPDDLITVPAETIRNLAFVVLLHNIAGELKTGPRAGLRLVFGAVGLLIGIQLSLDLLALSMTLSGEVTDDVLTTERLLRVTMASGGLVLLHNVYGQAAPKSRAAIRSAMLGLTLLWGYDLNLYTIAYLEAPGAAQLFDWRGAFVALLAPLFAVSGSRGRSLKIRLSRAATFQSLSLLAICGYFAVMAVLATALRQSNWNWASTATAGLLATMTVATVVVASSQWARGWLKVKVAKHLFEHRYDYRSEWLRFTETLGRSGPDAAPLGERIIQSFADIVDAPGGLLLVSDGPAVATAATWNWSGPDPVIADCADAAEFWAEVEINGRVLEFEALRRGWGNLKDRSVPVPQWMLDEPRFWAGVPLIHGERLIGIVLLTPPDFGRALDWEDFDLLRAAGRQAASSLAEAQGQQALMNAQRFEEFNRRFAFILHDIKNLVSQLSLLTRNAERHAENPEFRADMIATLKSSAGKMNDLLARLSPHSPARVQSVEAQPLRPILSAAIAAKRRDHDVRLIGDASLWATVDAGALEQAVEHLLQNAVEASTGGEPVVVRVGAADCAVSVSIIDKGEGMDGEFIRNRLFQPFASTKSGGFGIGSFEARSLVAAMGGRLTVTSRRGHGATFVITLPLAEPAVDSKTQTQRKRA